MNGSVQNKTSRAERVGAVTFLGRISLLALALCFPLAAQGPSGGPFPSSPAVTSTPYSFTFTPSGGAGGPYTITLNSGPLPAGLSLTSATVLSGTPAVPGSYPLTFTVADKNSNISNFSGTLTVTAGALAAYTTLASFQAASAGTLTSVTMPGTPGGGVEYSGNTVTLSSVAFSAGALLDCGGTYPTCSSNTGTGWIYGGFGADHLRAVLPTTINVKSAGGDYGAYLGNNPQTAIITGTTVGGVSLNITTGALGTGTTFVGFVSSNATDPVASVVATTGSGSNGPALTDYSYYSTAWPALSITTRTPLLRGATGSPYNITMAGSGGSGLSSNYSWSATGLPTGLSMSSLGVITGTPSVAGTSSSIQITLTDARTGQSTGPQTFSLLIRQSTTTAFTSSLTSPSTFGKPITITATVTPSTVTGPVTFYNGSTVLGTSTLASGQATVTTSLLPSGGNNIHAFYPGNTTTVGSSSTPLTQVVRSNNQDGFQTASSLGAGTGASQTSSVVAADFNGDGIPDLAVTNFGSSPGTVGVLIANIGGGFAPAVTYQVGTGPKTIAVGDFNGDGKVDLVVANSSADTVSVLLGNGNGTFQTQVPYSLGVSNNGATSIAVADFDGDGNADLAVTNSGTANITILFGTGTGTFGPADVISVTGTPISIVAADFDHDGFVDLAIANFAGSNITVLPGSAGGNFGAPVTYSLGSITGPRAIAVGDFNGDGVPDLVTGNSTSNNISVLLGTGTGAFGAAIVLSTVSGGTPYFVATGDFNGDGKLDIAAANEAGNSVAILLGDGGGGFAAVVPYSLGTAQGASWLAVADFNGDGVSDVAVANQTTSNVSVVRGQLSLFNGQSVTLTWYDPNLSTILGGPQTVTAGSGVEFPNFFSGNPAFNVDFADTTIEIDSAQTGGSNFAIGGGTTFNGLVITNPGTGRIPPFASVSLPTSSWLDGNGKPFTRSRISLDSTHIYVDFEGLVNLVGDKVILQVNPNVTPTTTTLTAAPDPSATGQAVTLTANVTLEASGSVSFFQNSVNPANLLGSATLNGSNPNQATLSVSTLPPGATHLIAFYNGDGVNDVSASNTVAQNVYNTTTTGLTSSQNPAPPGFNVTFTATVTPNTATGTANFTADGNNIGSGTLNSSGVATVSTSSLTAGSHAIVATYAGDATDFTSVSNTVTQAIKTTTHTSLSVSTNIATFGAAVTLNASVSGANTGKVTFYNGATLLDTVNMSNGAVALTTKFLPVGVNRITAFYLGDNITLPSLSPIPQTVTVTSVPQSGFNPGALFNTTSVGPWGMAKGDFNNDGKTDVVVANYNSISPPARQCVSGQR